MSGGPQVRVAQGELLGRVSVTPAGNNYYSFQGIPYAKPPVGTLRFKAPQNPSNWARVRDATIPGSPCAQMDPYRPKELKGSEDCLYLNVFTPQLPSNITEKLPVIVFIHGGRFQAGYGSYYQPEYFIDKNVIMVTINYRLHILGFLALGIPECPGNAALKDVAFAMRWIKKNIVNFSGDPNNVTAFGESAGAAIASSLIVSPMSKGLAHKVITESGTFVHDVFFREEDTVEKARNAAKMLGKDIKDPEQLLQYFQSLSVHQVAELNWDIMRKQEDMRSYFSPVIEPVFEGVESFFPEDPVKATKEGRYERVPIIVGYNSHEAAMFLTRNKKGNIIYRNVEYFIPKFLGLNENSDKFKRVCKEVKQFYFGDKSISDETLVQYVELFSDNLFLRDQDRYLDSIVKHQNNAWLFRFSYMGSLNAPFSLKSLGVRGASHSDELPYHFYKKGKKHHNLTENDKRIVEFFSKSWTNFARYGNPEVEVSVQWLPITKDKRHCLNIDKTMQLIEYPEKQRMEFWKYICVKFWCTKSKL